MQSTDQLTNCLAENDTGGVAMDLGLRGDVAVVLGAAGGIGRAIAQEFVKEGARIALLDRDLAVLELAAQLSGGSAGQVIGQVVDVTNYSQMQQIATSLEETLGPVAHVVFAVGIGSGKTGFPFWNIEPEAWGRVFAVDLFGAVHTLHAFTPSMIERRRGTFAFLASVAGQTGSQTDPPYSAAKAALINLVQCAAKDLAPYDIRVNSLNPGMVDTPLSQQIWAASNHHLPEAERPDYEAWAQDKLKRMVPLNRWVEPQDVAAMAVFLASARAQNITGQALNVDGGYVMHS